MCICEFEIFVLNVVVALFNAISKSKREAAAEVSDEIPADKKSKKSKQHQKSEEAKIAKLNFFEMLQSDKAKATKVDAVASSVNEKEAAGDKKEKEKWSVLRDDFMIDRTLKLKVI